MAIETTRTITNNGFVYPYVLVHMSISPKYDLAVTTAEAIEGVVALKLVPYRILESNLLDVWLDGAYSYVIDNVYQAASIDDALAQSMGTVLYGIQQFIQTKGL